MAVGKRGSIADLLGVEAGHIEGDFKIRRPEDPEKVRREHDQAMATLSLIRWTTAGTFALTALLCWMFLHYGKPEQAEKIVATVIGVVGGLGLGRQAASKS